ncbi:hypothetical protein Y1Q_0014615 [Alligator mississippiensis]|uniref:Uncharacterized protein n=1 Tax=Alligator mississippiensis TaxID=8496 RepID=A0A151P4I1_ALLMI|nr:hypothetical protein Y1Q_0014615 [Alligator mississippiensis]
MFHYALWCLGTEYDAKVYITSVKVLQLHVWERDQLSSGMHHWGHHQLSWGPLHGPALATEGPGLELE